MVIIAIAVLGLCLGSFVNALVSRLNSQQELIDRRERLPANVSKKAAKALDVKLREASIAHGRSRCPRCQRELAVRDLVPVLSYLWLRGRCRYCHKPIPDTPLVELLTPALFIISYLNWPYALQGPTLQKGQLLFGFWLVFLVGFVTLARYDLKWFLLPDRVVFPLALLAVLQVLILTTVYGGGWQELLSAGWGVLIASGIFWLLFQVSGGRWIGGGDVKLGLVLGLIIGGPGRSVLMLFIASLLGTLVALPLLAIGKANRGSQLPFGPYLLAATIIVYLWGSGLTAWYTRQLLG